MTEAAWGSDQYVGRFDYGEPDYADALCVRAHEQQFSAESYGLSGYRCGGKPPAWHTPPESSYGCRQPADKCGGSSKHVRGPPGSMASGEEGNRSGGWYREPTVHRDTFVRDPTPRERFDTPSADQPSVITASARDCVQITITKQWLFIIMFVLMMTLATSVGMCYKFMRKLSKHMKHMKATASV